MNNQHKNDNWSDIDQVQLSDIMTGGDVKAGKEGKERPALPVAGYEPLGWAGKAAPGLHLDVLKVLVLTVTISK